MLTLHSATITKDAVEWKGREGKASTWQTLGNDEDNIAPGLVWSGRRRAAHRHVRNTIPSVTVKKDGN